jgi:hypothetical protein
MPVQSTVPMKGFISSRLISLATNSSRVSGSAKIFLDGTSFLSSFQPVLRLEWIGTLSSG